MIQVSAKYVNLGINLKRLYVTDPTKPSATEKFGLPQRKFFKPIPQCILKFRPTKFSFPLPPPRWENSLRNRPEV